MIKDIPTVSIIMPTYNGEKFIAASIASVLEQTYARWELLIIDDGSTDNTKKIVATFLSDKRIRYIENKRNQGIQKTLNRGLRESKGEYIARIDDDDEWSDKNKLFSQINFFTEHKEYVLLGTGIIAVHESGVEQMRYIPPIDDIEIRKKILQQNCFAHSSVLFKKSAALSVGGYSEKSNIRHIEDYDLWLKMGLIGKFANLDTYSVTLMLHENSITAKNRIVQARRAVAVAFFYSGKYPNYISGLLVSYARLSFFSFRKIVPIPISLVITIKKIVKNF